MKRHELVQRWKAWAAEHHFELDRHDAAYGGMIEGIAVYVDTGVRDSGLYDVVVKLPIATGMTPAIVRRDTPVAEGDDVHRVRRAVEELAESVNAIKSIAIHEDELALRFAHGTEPDIAVDLGARRVIEAWKAFDPNAVGAYR